MTADRLLNIGVVCQLCDALCLWPSGSLMYLNEATLLNNVRVRYSKDRIYVSADFSV